MAQLILATDDELLATRNVPGYPGFRVDEFGNAYSCWKRGKFSSEWHKLKWQTNRRYPSVYCRLTKRNFIEVHLLVLFAFHGPRPNGHHACHYDGNCYNCHAPNLRWGTPKTNGEDRVRHGTSLRGEKHPRVKLTSGDAIKIKQSLASGAHPTDLAKQFNVARTTIIEMRRKKSWAHILPELAMPKNRRKPRARQSAENN